MKKLLVLLALTSVALVGLSSMAGAAISIPLGIGNAALSGFPPDYGVVEIALNSPTMAHIILDALVGKGPNQYLFGDGGSVALNVNGPFSIGGISGSGTGTGFTPGPYSNGGAGTEDGFGTFNLTINSFDGFTHASQRIEFDLFKSSGTWSSESDILTPNADGFMAAAHIFVTPFPADAANGALTTGFAANGETTATPEPATMLLLWLGIAGVEIVRRRAKR